MLLITGRHCVSAVMQGSIPFFRAIIILLRVWVKGVGRRDEFLWINMWIMSGIIEDNLVNYVENRGKTAIISCRTLRKCIRYIRHIHISTENAARLPIDLLPDIRYTNEAPLRESRFRFPERASQFPWERSNLCAIIGLREHP